METVLNGLSFFTLETAPELSVIVTLSVSIISTFGLTFLHTGSLRHKLFVTLSLQFFFCIGEIITYLCYDFICAILNEDLIIEDFVFGFFSKIVTFIFLLIIILITNCKKPNYTLQYNLLILLTPIVSLISLTALGISTGNISHESITYAISLIAILGLTLLNFTNYVLLDELLLSTERKNREKQLVKQLNYQSEKYDMISTAYRETRRLIHDTKKHLFYIRSALDTASHEHITEYINNELDDLDNNRILVNSGNLVIDAFVSNYIQLSRKESIDFRTKIHIVPGDLTIDTYSLSIIIGNLLENSIIACRKIPTNKTRYIHFEAYTSEKQFVLHICNPMPEDDSVNSTSYETTSLHHGFGMKNIENIVDKCQGAYTYEITNKEYSSIIVLPLHC